MKSPIVFSVSHSFTSCPLANVPLGFAVTLNMSFKGELYIHVCPATDKSYKTIFFYVDCDSGALEIKENVYIYKYRI